MFSNKGAAPNCMVIFAVEIKSRSSRKKKINRYAYHQANKGRASYGNTLEKSRKVAAYLYRLSVMGIIVLLNTCLVASYRVLNYLWITYDPWF
jgi:hypothetical protein